MHSDNINDEYMPLDSSIVDIEEPTMPSLGKFGNHFGHNHAGQIDIVNLHRAD
jgi:hypothetical protein